MRRVCFVVLVVMPLALLPLTGALAKKGGGGGGGGNNSGGSDRSHEVRQNNGGGGGGGGGGQSGTGTPDDGDNMHPSGNDKSVEPGGSYPQGHSQSDPDGMSNGGADKPGGTGGIDQDDQDGNNGCGNDDDFEDDNNGNCGGLKKGQTETPGETETPGGGEVEEPSAVDGGVVSNPTFTGSGSRRFAVVEPVFTASGEIDGSVVGPPESFEASNSSPVGTLADAGARVLGAVAENLGHGSHGSGILPLSGTGIATLLFASGGLVAIGLTLRRASRS